MHWFLFVAVFYPSCSIHFWIGRTGYNYNKDEDGDAEGEGEKDEHEGHGEETEAERLHTDQIFLIINSGTEMPHSLVCSWGLEPNFLLLDA